MCHSSNQFFLYFIFCLKYKCCAVTSEEILLLCSEGQAIKLNIVIQYCSCLGLCFSLFHQARGTGEAVTDNCTVCTPELMGNRDMKPLGFQKAPYTICYKESPPVCPRIQDIELLPLPPFREGETPAVGHCRQKKFRCLVFGKRQHQALMYCPILSFSMGGPNMINIVAVLWCLA